ncbi:MAG: transglycosylase SLT domain-containing protein [Rikenellaceae bacterium]|nr:transglycosylase SLT domain-containing protein [Rikenellaceae bacterium]
MKRFTFCLTVFIATLTIANGSGNENIYGQLNIKYSPEQYDSLLSLYYESSILTSYDDYLNKLIDIDISSVVDTQNIPDSIYDARLKMIASVIPLPYNDIVRKYIITYTTRLNRNMSNIFGLAKYYFPLFEEELDRQGLPSELKILPVIESALYPKAVSRAGATDLWQFMLATGKGVGLEINSFVDERMDPIASTKAACTYLSQLYSIYEDWTLALAAYNCGPGNVNKALKRAPNAETFWDIYNYLPKETRGYIPSFIAATYAYTFHKVHNINPVLPVIPMTTDTITVKKMLHLEQVASTIDISMDILRELNPHYKRDIVPSPIEKGYSLILPQQGISAFIEKEDEIYSKDTIYLKKYIDPQTGKFTDTVKTTQRTYKVKKNDVLGKIARQHNVTVSAIMKENNLKNANSLRIGQVLRIP